jgi:hypothetical protein
VQVAKAELEDSAVGEIVAAACPLVPPVPTPAFERLSGLTEDSPVPGKVTKPMLVPVLHESLVLAGAKRDIAGAGILLRSART